ncbi:hypothetical protein OAU51_00400 [Porticoccaceae bacterium]|nr:hypothetical protein [Porticoccaceae bacterium]
MTTFRQISGQLVKSYTTNPDNPLEGQMWYNQTELKLKGVVASGAWISTSPLNTARDAAGGAGIQTAAMVFGGRNEIDGPPTGGPNQKYNLNEEYNGTGYSTGGALVQGRQGLSGAGTQTAGLGVGGYHPPAPGPKSLVEEYDGSTWSEVNDIPTATFAMGSAGTQTAAVVTGGRTPSWVASTYEYDGTTWTGGGALGTARTLRGAMTGTLTAALAVGGDLNPPGGATNKVEEYNGTAWTEVNSYPTNINVNMVSGIQTSALSFGGAPYTTNAFTYDGTNFTATASMGSPVSGQNTLKTATNNSTGLSMGGYGTSSYIATSEEYNFSTQVITPAAWSSGPSVNNSRLSVNNGLGPTSASLIFGGNPGTAPYASTGTEEYDGSSWTTGGNTPAQATNFSGAAGTQTSALGFASSDTPTLLINYDGSTWSVNPSSFPGTSNGSGTGESNSAIYAGYSGTNSLEWDGASWTAGGTMNTSRTTHGTGFGNASSAIFATGSTGPSGVVTADSEEYDGTTWTSVGDVITARRRLAASRPLSSASGYIFGGVTPTNNFSPAYTNTESWNGTNWSTSPNLAVGTGNQFGAGTTDAFNISGHSTAITAATEIFNPETTAANIVDITTS